MPYKNVTFTLESVIKSFEEKRIAEKINNRNRGVIYTPQPIADLMVLNIFRIFVSNFSEMLITGENFDSAHNFSKIFIENKNLRNELKTRLKRIKILDPACGTGRFLIAVANLLFNFYKICEPEQNTFDLKKKIIQNHIFGIDIDKTSILMSKLKLIKWVYSKNENRLNENKDNHPSLGEIEEFVDNINLNFNLFNMDYLIEFDGQNFDIIIGNPPYVENKKIVDKEFKKEIKKNFESAYRLYDLSVVFIEKSLKTLKNGIGCLSFLTTNKFLSAEYGLKIRDLLLRTTEIKEIINISSLPIFKNTAAYPIILSCKKNINTKNIIVIKNYDNIADFKHLHSKKLIKFPQRIIHSLPSFIIPLNSNANLINYLYANFKPLSKAITDLNILYRPFGFIKWAENFKYMNKHKASDKDLLLLGTGNVGKYFINFDKRIKIANVNEEVSYFSYQPEYKEVWSKLSSEKLIFREISKEITCVYDPGIFVNLTGLYFLKVPSFKTDDYFCLLSILNSDFLNQVFNSLYGTLHMSGNYLRYNGSFMKTLPMPESFPIILSKIGRINQFLSQLVFFLLLESNSSFKNEINSKNIGNLLEFYKKLSNSLVYQLYMRSEEGIELNNLLKSANLLPNIKFKYFLPRFDLPKYIKYTNRELRENIDQIYSCSKILSSNLDLMHEINNYYLLFLDRQKES
ncbi:MAG: Eco57I restriction-modification methylase domain-containing protein [Candidatus Lokiarchaeota archaeon]|nr:Eco57I restriction-modification methylase domain-containing protein [Candidatus Lokiarchaeota archaeon]